MPALTVTVIRNKMQRIKNGIKMSIKHQKSIACGRVNFGKFRHFVLTNIVPVQKAVVVTLKLSLHDWTVSKVDDKPDAQSRVRS